MKRKLLSIGVLCSVAAYADFSYDQTSKITGGAIQSMLKVASVFSKSLREPIRTTHMVKGNRMAMIGPESIEVIDLDQETFTEINLKAKTYAVSTFAEVRAALEKQAEKMRKEQAKRDQPEMNFRAEVKNTGATRNINGMDTKQAILTLSADVKDKEGNQGGTFDIVMDMWLAPQIGGYQEVKDFYARLAAKQVFNPLTGLAGAMMAQHSKGMNDMVKEMSKLEGVPVLQYVRIGAAGAPGAAGQPQSEQQAAPQQREQQQPKSISDAAGSAIGGRLGRLGGGLGGFGRKKKTEEEAQPAPQAPPPQQSGSAPAQGGQASFMEMESQLTSFTSSVDASKFDVPAGFKKTDSKKYRD